MTRAIRLAMPDVHKPLPTQDPMAELNTLADMIFGCITPAHSQGIRFVDEKALPGIRDAHADLEDALLTWPEDEDKAGRLLAEWRNGNVSERVAMDWDHDEWWVDL